MISGLYSFSQILEDVILETGQTNLRNRIPEMRNLVARAEREINPYAGLLLRKKMIYYVGNGNFNGKYIKKPKDYVFSDKIGCCEDGLCDGSYEENVSHIIICDNKVRTEITFSYWGLQSDGQGNPVTTYNHADAVVAYIIWKLYSPKVFMGEGSLNVKMELEKQFEERCGEARGEDMFPSETSMNNIYKTSSWSSLEMNKKTEYDRCISCDNCIVAVGDNPIVTSENIKVYYWQLNSKHQDIDNVKPLITFDYLQDKQNETLEVFGTGFIVVNPYLGRLNFAVALTPFQLFKIYDILNNDVTDEFDKHYFQDSQIMLFTTKAVCDQNNIFYKILLGVNEPGSINFETIQNQRLFQNEFGTEFE